MGRVGNIRELVSAIFLAAVGLIFCLGGFLDGIGSPKNPGEGFMPLLSGGALFLLSVAFLVQGTRRAKASREVKSFWPEKESKSRVAAVLISILAYALVFEVLLHSL